MSSPRMQPVHPGSSVLKRQNPLFHLLHALNQPLTGLQCSLELASARRHAAEEYARTLQDALELTARMRVLVEALREIADSEYSEQTQQDRVRLNDLLSTQIENLLPVSESIGVHVTAQRKQFADRCGTRNVQGIDSSQLGARERARVFALLAAGTRASDRASGVGTCGWHLESTHEEDLSHL